jgi:hypothetical protein
MSKIEVDAIDKQSGSTLTIGGSGTTVQLGSGASQTGFGREGSVNWQTGSIKTAATFTAANGEGYFIDTSSNEITANLPAGSAGAIVAFSDYARNFATNNLTISPNGSEKIGGVAADLVLSVNGQAMTLVYVDSTKGWINVQNAEDTKIAAEFLVATGGTIVDCGNFRTHIFTGPGTFTVSQSALSAPNNNADYVVVAGGAGGGTGRGGGGGAGGFRMSNALSLPAPTTSPLASPSGVTLSVQAYPIVVGSGGAARAYCGTACAGNPGSNSSGFSITSAGGGGGGSGPGRPIALDGGSGGGGNFNIPGDKGDGNVPPVSPPQGNDGGVGSLAPESPPGRHGGGGGGAGAAGSNETGGAGSFLAEGFIGPTSGSYGTPGPVGSTRYFAGGGGAGFEASGGGSGGAGGGANGSNTSSASSASANTGGGGGSNGENPGTSSGGGGSGIVMIRYKFQ